MLICRIRRIHHQRIAHQTHTRRQHVHIGHVQHRTVVHIARPGQQIHRDRRRILGHRHRDYPRHRRRVVHASHRNLYRLRDHAAQTVNHVVAHRQYLRYTRRQMLICRIRRIHQQICPRQRHPRWQRTHPRDAQHRARVHIARPGQQIHRDRRRILIHRRRDYPRHRRLVVGAFNAYRKRGSI